MASVNKVILVGRIGQEPELRTIPSGTSVTEISMVTSEKFTDKQGNKNEKAEWHKVTFWGKQAELVCQYCNKGSELYVEGKLETSEWKDKDGNKRFTTKVTAKEMQFIGGKSQGQGQNQGGYQNSGNGQNQNNQNPPQNNAPAGGNDFIEDNCPF